MPLALYGLSLFLSAALMFVLEPLVGRQLLPVFGGSPAVWNSCVVFFQTALLAGYAYSHALDRLPSRAQALAHVVVVAVPLALLPLSFSLGGGHAGVLDLGRILLFGVSAPFFALSTTGPLLQRWFSRLGHQHSADPYFLYVASNVGSLSGLLAFPFVLEPALGLSALTHWWSAGYCVFAALLVGCAATAFLRASDVAHSGASTPPIAPRQALSWVILGAVPASLTLGVTQYSTTNIAAVPLLWVIPLALYLGTFIVAFLPRAAPVVGFAHRALPWAALVIALSMAFGVQRPIALLLALHWFGLVLAGLSCHGRLAHDRPSVDRLTLYFLLVALGGVLGSSFNALVAPMIFPDTIEYPLMVVLACAVRPATGSWRSALALAAIFVVGWSSARQGQLLLIHRTFFGVHRVVQEGNAHALYHGNTIHGAQLYGSGTEQIPALFYHPSGPLGEVFRGFPEDRLKQVAVVGLGSGAVAAYGRPGTALTFFEIDPEVERIARDETLFTYLQSSAADVRVQIGDARLELGSVPDGSFGLLVLDAFSSDAIPMHLLTAEAVELYARKVGAHGLLLFHVSNRYLDFAPVLAAIADQVGLVGAMRVDTEVTEQQASEGKLASKWILLAHDEADVASLQMHSPGWGRLSGCPDRVLWTDDYANILSVLAWQ